MKRSARTARLVTGAALAALLVPAAAGATHRVAVPVSNGEGNSSSTFLAGSSDGSKVLFGTSQALVAEDQDNQSDIYQRQGGRLTLISVGDGGFDDPQAAKFIAATPTLSHVLWESQEDVTGTDSDGGQPDLYVRSNDQTRLVTQGPFPSFSSVNPFFSVRMSSDGSHIAFQTNAQLVFTDNDGGTEDVYENFNGLVRLLSPGGSGPVALRGMSADGNRVFMSTAAALLAADTDGLTDIYERVNGTTTNLLTPNTAVAVTWAGASANGLHVFFTTSESLNAVLDTDTSRDVYERFNGATTLVSTSATAGNGAFDASFQRVSADGTRVIFTTGEGLDPADQDSPPDDPLDDIYIREANVTTLVSGGELADGEIVVSEMTPDGQNVFWYSSQTFAGDGDGGFKDAWRWNNGTITRVSVGAQNDDAEHDAAYSGRSGDLSSLFFQSTAQFTASDTDPFEDVYERDGTTTRLITPTAPTPCTLLPSIRCASRFDGASATGDQVWFTSEENLHPADGDDLGLPGAADVYESRYLGTPAVATDPEVNAHIEGDPQPIDPSLTVTEASDDIFGATVKITAGFEATDRLGFEDQPGITGSLNGAGDTLTLIGRGTAADFENALRSVTYTTLSETPSGATRTVEFTVDNGGHTGSGTRSLTVTAANDAPVVDPGPGPPDYIEGVGPVALVPDSLVSDADSPTLAGATVRILDGFAAGEDVLAVTAADGISGTQVGDTLTLTGTATLAQYQGVLRTVAYENVSEDPTEATRLFELAVTDGDRQSNPVYVSFGVFQRSIDVTNATLVYSENAPATAVDPAVAILNFDLPAVQGATVEITEGFAAGEDLLAFTDTALITGTSSSGGKKLTLTGEASVDDYIAALRSVTYRNLSESPSGADRVVTFAVVDGLGSDARRIDVVGVDDAPVLVAGAAGDPFVENGLAAAIAPALSISDTDSATLTGAVVRIESGHDGADEELTTTEKLPDGILAAWNPVTATFTFTGVAPVADYVAALRSVALQSQSEHPSTATRIVSFTASSSAATSAPVSLQTTVVAENDVPVVSVSSTPLAYTEGDEPVAVDGGLTVEDPDSQLVGATAKLVSGQEEGADVLQVADADDGITVTVDDAEQSITFAGPASVTAYRTALRAVRYLNRSAAATGDRVVEFRVTDGPSVSTAVGRTITLGVRAPASVGLPVISGATRVGGTLTASLGGWEGSEPMTFSRRWQRCSESGAGCTDVPGATGETFAPGAADVGARLRVMVTADNVVAGTVAATSALTQVIRVALAAPIVTSGPTGLTSRDSGVLRFTGEDGAALSCSLDGAAFAACESPVALAGLNDGDHVLRVRQQSDGLLSGVAERRWTVDTTPPRAPSLLSAPDAETVARSASISFAGLPGETFECALDGADATACTSPATFDDLAIGAHTLLVRALDAAGNAGPALRVRWTIASAVAAPEKATVLVLRAPRAIARGARSFEAGCALDGGVLERCEVIARVHRRGHLVRIGRGIVVPSGDGTRSAAVRVRITRSGRAALRRAGRNARVRLTGKATQAGSPFNLIDVATPRAR